MANNSRRAFLKKSVASAAAVGFVPYLFSSVQPALSQSPSDRLRMGCIGVGSMGRGDAAGFNDLCDIVAVCDVDSSHITIAQRHPQIGRKGADGNKIIPEGYKDYRHILDRDDIDIVSIVTPDHWHVKICIEALQAGKHVFCQKPLTLTIEEGQLIRKACEKYKKTFQVGTQQRAQRDQFLLAAIMVRNGMLGEIKKITCDISPGNTCAPIPQANVPSTLDFEKWLGQAPVVEYIATTELKNPNNEDAWPKNSRTHYEFRWWYEYSGGKFTDWGAHHIDCAMWALGKNVPTQGQIKFNPIIAEHPVPFKNGYPTENNRYNTCKTFQIETVFDDGIIMDVCSNTPDGKGVLFEGTNGKIHVNRERIKGKPFENIGGQTQENGSSMPYNKSPELQKNVPEAEFVKLFNGKPIESHKRNFLRCIREGGMPVSDVDSHIQAMNVCHLCAISARLGREITWDPKTEKTGDTQSQSFIARERRKGYDIPNVS